MEKAQTLDNTHKINTIHRNSLIFNQCKMTKTEKSESQNTATTTVTRFRCCCFCADRSGMCNVLRIRGGYGTEDSRREVPQTTIS